MGEVSTVAKTDPMGASDPKTSTIPDERRCRATNKAGNRCGSRAIPGGFVCRLHGGAAPQVRRKARLRLAELVDPAVAQLARILTTADKDADKLRAIENILDRTGYGRASTVEVEDTRAVILDRIAEIQARRAETIDSEDIEDAEVVDETTHTPEEDPS